MSAIPESCWFSGELSGSILIPVGARHSDIKGLQNAVSSEAELNDTFF